MDVARPASPRSVTILDVAREAKVSKSTVSLVLQHSPLIKEDTAARVREAASRLGYVYNRRAAELRRQSSNIVCVVINDLTNPFFAELLVGLEQSLVEAGYICLMAHTNERLDIQDKVLASMREQSAAGLILCPAFATPDAVQELVSDWGIPLLVVVRPLGDGAHDYVGAETEDGFAMATEHLIAQGHERIAFLGRVGGGAAYERRRSGYERAMNKHGLSIAPDWLVNVAPTHAGGHVAIREVLALPHPPTAAVCYNDVVAFGVLSGLGELARVAGEDFAVVGFDGLPLAAHSNPPLSTIDVGPRHLGEIAARVLLQRLRVPDGPPMRHLTQPRLVVRQSSARPRPAKGTPA